MLYIGSADRFISDCKPEINIGKIQGIPVVCCCWIDNNSIKMYRGRAHELSACILANGDHLEQVKPSRGIVFAACHRQQPLALSTLRVLIPDIHPRRYSLIIFFLGNQLVELSYSKKTTTGTLEFHHIAVHGNQVEGTAGVMSSLLFYEPTLQM